MRVSVIFFVVLATAVCAAGDTIHLKNGRTIWAEQVRENGSHIEYTIGDDSYAIPKSAVDHIDSGGAPPQSGGSSASQEIPDLPTLNAASPMQNQDGISAKIIHDGKVDPDALSALEQQGDSHAAAVGYYLAGKFEFEHGDFPKSRTYLEAALRLDSANPAVLTYYAALLVRTGNPTQALIYAERAVRLAPDSADALTVLGYAQFAADRTADAIRTWKRSLAIRPDPSLQQFLDKAQREAHAEAEFSQNETSHFTLRYEGKQSSDSLRREILATLESEYDELVREIGVEPRNNIAVVLYTEQAYFDVTRAPAWTGAVNDGKLRIPIDGLSTVTPELARVLKHELAHSFINQLSNGRCPQWLNEGIAQLIEPKSMGSFGRHLAQIFQGQQEIPYNALEGSFIQFSNVQANLAYEESLAAAEYINATYGMSDLRRILDRVGQGSSPETALRMTIHASYGELQDEVAKYLADKYGS